MTYCTLKFILSKLDNSYVNMFLDLMAKFLTKLFGVIIELKVCT